MFFLYSAVILNYVGDVIYYIRQNIIHQFLLINLPKFSPAKIFRYTVLKIGIDKEMYGFYKNATWKQPWNNTTTNKCIGTTLGHHYYIPCFPSPPASIFEGRIKT